MFSRCPQCHAVHPLAAAQLAAARGLVRCGHCNCEFNALGHLFDHWPDSHTAPAIVTSRKSTPLLGDQASIEQDTRDEVRSEAQVLPADRNSRLWLALIVLLCLTTLANLAWTFKTPLLENASVRTWLSERGLIKESLIEELTVMPFRDLSMLHLVSRDMHQHPSRTGMLVLSIIFVNRAEQTQAYPTIRVNLMDSANGVLATRRFSAEDYLPQSVDPRTGMPPGVHIPILLEFVDPGTGATGFELQFE